MSIFINGRTHILMHPRIHHRPARLWCFSWFWRRTQNCQLTQLLTYLLRVHALLYYLENCGACPLQLWCVAGRTTGVRTVQRAAKTPRNTRTSVSARAVIPANTAKLVCTTDIYLWTHLFANRADTDRKIQIYTERYKIKHYQIHNHRNGTANY